jgi:alkanesulfonate monooxygenase SsuD/methylene tetrahydromethanopterin reductase-like flavin-dependent oxidoreductase (luciferase family)
MMLANGGGVSLGSITRERRWTRRTTAPRIALMRFDLFRSQSVSWSTFVEDARYIESTSAGTLWVLDHYLYPPHPEAQILDSWTTLAALATQTSRIRIGTMVTDVALRHPAMLAKQVATVDCISEGRVDLTMGAGYFEAELESLGIAFLSPSGRAQRLREAVEVVDGLLRGEQMSYHGEHYRLEDAGLVPAPVQKPRPPLLVAANRRRGLRLAAERADVSVSLGDQGASVEDAVAAVRERNMVLDDYCTELGRDPGTLDRAYYFGWADERPFASAESLREYIGMYSEAGVRRFVFVFSATDGGGAFATRDALESFAAEILSP